MNRERATRIIPPQPERGYSATKSDASPAIFPKLLRRHFDQNHDDKKFVTAQPRNADFQVCCIAGFPTCETCTTDHAPDQQGSYWHRPQTNPRGNAIDLFTKVLALSFHETMPLIAVH